MTQLFEPTKIGAIDVKNKMVMAPLTRGRAGESRVPNDLMAEYYAQRAGAGLIITEATAINAQGYGWYGAPAAYTDEHFAGWKKTTDAVHAKGGKIVLQMWHMGRVTHPDHLDGAQPVGPSDNPATEGSAFTKEGKKPYVQPRTMTVEEIQATTQDYVHAAEKAIAAGFDGVEIHAANGYLLDQFIRDGSNKRDDAYGGSIESRIRFAYEVANAVSDAIGADRTGLRISPTNPFNDMKDSDPVATFTTFAKALNPLNLAYLHVMEPIDPEHPFGDSSVYVTPHIREIYDGHLMVNGSYDQEKGEETLQSGKADSICYGVPFLTTPDLVERYKQGEPLNEPNYDGFYTGGAEGYTDYPTLDQLEKAA